MAKKPAKRTKQLNRSVAGNVGVVIVLSLFGAFMLLPMIYSVCQALKPMDELFVFPPRFFVRNPTLKSFRDLFRLIGDQTIPFSRYIFNTVLISVTGTFGHVIIASMAAYAFAKMKFPGSKWMFQTIVTALLFNATVLGIPSFMVFTWLGLLDNPLVIILPAWQSTLGLYLMKQNMESIQDAVLEAARIDGAGEFRIFFGIVMPTMKPAWLTLIVLSFSGLWNTGAVNTIYSENWKTLNYAMSQILAGGIARTNAAAAASVVMMIVPIAVFIFTQSNVVETMGSS
ncbi:MAG: carbohydrate ABC transporter permease, partial [Ruminococcaceae bacterium]|nr:carbohydrate ABC transporter permease [Oscillospiraceae bacterium]